MLPINAIQLKRAHQLEPGDFAILKDYSDALVLVGSISEHIVAVYLEPVDKRCNTVEVNELSGAAIR